MICTPARTIALIAAAALLLGCDDGEDGTANYQETITVSAEQESEMCDDLVTSSSTAPVPKTAGAEIGEGGAIDAQSGRKEILFTEFAGQLGGYIRLSVNPDNQTPVFAMVDGDVDFAVVDSDGYEIVDAEYEDGPEACDAAARSILWLVEGTESHLRFGPTAEESTFLVLETVD